MKKLIFVSAIVLVAAMTGCQATHQTLQIGPNDPSELHKFSQAVATRDLETLAELEQASRVARAAVELIVERSYPPESEVPALWETEILSFRAQETFAAYLFKATKAANVGLEPQLAGAARELLDITVFRTEGYLTARFGRDEMLAAKAEAQRRAVPKALAWDSRELGALGQMQVLDKTKNRQFGYSALLNEILDRAQRPDEQFWRAEARAAHLYGLFVLEAMQQMESGVPDQYVRILEALGVPTALRITLRLKEVFPSLQDSYESLSESNFLLLAGANNADVVAYATFEVWLLEKEPRVLEVLGQEFVLALWSVFRVQLPEVYDGPGEVIESAQPTPTHSGLFSYEG